MSNLATATHLRPSQRSMERRVAEVEDGYTRLINALYREPIGADLTKNQSKITHVICCKTYGYDKKMDRISDSQLIQITRLPRQKVNEAKNELTAIKVILREGQQVGPNKNIEEWQIEGCHYSGGNVIVLVTRSITKTVTALSPKQEHTKETITKERRNNENTMSESVRTECEKSPDRHEETNKAFGEILWCAGMWKAGKKNAASAFRTQFRERCKTTRGMASESTTMLAEDIAYRNDKQFGSDRLLPSSYLNDQRWNGERPETIQPQSKPSSIITVSKTGYVLFDRRTMKPRVKSLLVAGYNHGWLSTSFVNLWLKNLNPRES